MGGGTADFFTAVSAAVSLAFPAKYAAEFVDALGKPVLGIGIAMTGAEAGARLATGDLASATQTAVSNGSGMLAGWMVGDAILKGTVGELSGG